MKPKEWRTENKLSIDQMADILGFSKGYISEIENGRKNGSSSLWLAYHKATNGQVTANDFFHGGV